MRLDSKIIAVALTCLSVTSHVASAQQTSLFYQEEADNKRTFYGGLTLGANFSQVDGDGFEGYHRVGLHAGPLVYARIKRNIFGSLEFLYAQKGSKARYSTESIYLGTTIEGYDLKLNYVEVPLLIHYNYRPRFSFGLGASYARLLSWKEDAFTDFPVNLHPEVNYFRKDDWCAMAEGTYEFWKGWLVALRFAYSVNSIRDRERIPQGYGGGYFSGQYNNLWTLNLVYFFRSKSTSDQ